MNDTWRIGSPTCVRDFTAPLHILRQICPFSTERPLKRFRFVTSGDTLPSEPQFPHLREMRLWDSGGPVPTSRLVGPCGVRQLAHGPAPPPPWHLPRDLGKPLPCSKMLVSPQGKRVGPVACLRDLLSCGRVGVARPAWGSLCDSME